MQKHEFALFYPTLSLVISPLRPGDSFTVSDEQLFRRMTQILRLAVGESVTLFDGKHQAVVTVQGVAKKNQIQVMLQDKQPVPELKPSIKLLLPLLKKEALEQALYAAVELGASEVQLLLTQKVQRSWSEKDMPRLHNVMLAAAEQSKNFAHIPLLAPISLRDALSSVSSTTSLVCCAVDGAPLQNVLARVTTAKSLALVVGPEGDFTHEEYEELGRHNAIMCALTPTVLRAQQALTLGLGILRSMTR